MNIDALLDRAQAAAEDENYEVVREVCEQVLEKDPRSAEARELLAIALSELGDLDAADALWDALVGENPDDETMRFAAGSAFIRGPGNDERERIDRGLSLIEPLTRSKDEDLRLDALVMTAIGLNQIAEPAGAEAAARRALKIEPEAADARLELGAALFEQAKFAEAKRVYEAARDSVPGDATAYFQLGLIAERLEPSKAAALFATATELDPDLYPAPQVLSDDEFDAAVQAAIDSLPPQSREPLQNATIDVDPLPSDEDLDGGRLSPTMLGIFHGVGLDERSPLVAEHHQTAVIKLFQNNLQRFARSREELVEEIGITLLHEVGHLMGLDEDDLYDRGLD